MTPAEKSAATAASNRMKRKAKTELHRELFELMIKNLQRILNDDSISNESRLSAVILMNELRKELHF